MNELTFTERNDHSRRVQRINKFQNDAVQVAIDLKHIYDTKSYREDHDSFQDFCIKELKIKKSRAYQILNFGGQKLLGSEAENERQSRGSKKSTMVENQDDLNQKEEIIELDKEGYAIPKNVIEGWKRAEEIGEELLSSMRHVKTSVEKGLKDRDIAFIEMCEVNLADIRNDFNALKVIVPYAVCKCEGFQMDKCKLCNGRGYVSKFLWDTFPIEIKSLRKIKK